MIWTEEFLNAVEACQEGKDWMVANNMYGKTYEEIKSELARQVEANEVDQKEAELWFKWAKKLESDGLALRLSSTIKNDTTFRLEIEGLTYDNLTTEHLEALKADIKKPEVTERVEVEGGVVHKPTRRIRPGRTYNLFDPRTGITTQYSDVTALRAAMDDIARYKESRVKVKRRVETDDGLVGYEGIE